MKNIFTAFHQELVENHRGVKYTLVFWHDIENMRFDNKWHANIYFGGEIYTTNGERFLAMARIAAQSVIDYMIEGMS